MGRYSLWVLSDSRQFNGTRIQARINPTPKSDHSISRTRLMIDLAKESIIPLNPTDYCIFRHTFVVFGEL